MAEVQRMTVEEAWKQFSTGTDLTVRVNAARVLRNSRDYDMHARVGDVACNELLQLALPTSIDDPVMRAWVFLVPLLERLVLFDPKIRTRVADVLIQRAQEICVIEGSRIDGLVLSALRKYVSLAAHSGLYRLEPFLKFQNGRYRLAVFSGVKNVLEVRPLRANESAGGLLSAARATASTLLNDEALSPEGLALIIGGVRGCDPARW